MLFSTGRSWEQSSFIKYLVDRRPIGRWQVHMVSWYDSWVLGLLLWPSKGSPRSVWLVRNSICLVSYRQCDSKSTFHHPLLLLLAQVIMVGSTKLALLPFHPDQTWKCPPNHGGRSYWERVLGDFTNRAYSKLYYDGDILHVTCEDGSDIRATVNHVIKPFT